MQKANVFFEELLTSFTSEKNDKQTKTLTEEIKTNTQIKKQWEAVLSQVFNKSTAMLLGKSTTPGYIKKNTLYIFVKQSDELFFLNLHQQKILQQLKQNQNKFDFPKIIEKLTRIIPQRENN